MGLICPCGTGSGQEERETPKRTSTGVSTQQPKGNCSQPGQKKVSSPSKKPLVVSEESTDSFRQSAEHPTRSNRQPRVKGTSCHTREIKKELPAKEKGSQKKENQRRSRSSSSHRDRTVQDVRKSEKHRHRGHSAEVRSGEKKTVLSSSKRREHHHKQYGGTDTKAMSAEVKITNNFTHSGGVAKGHSKHRKTEVTVVVKPEMKAPGGNRQSSRPEKEKKAKEKTLPSMDKEKTLPSIDKEKTLPSTNKEKYLKKEEQKKPRRARSSTPSYVIPMAAMLK